MTPTPHNILLTFDVEDWFQVENLRYHFPPATWDQQELRVEKNTNKLLDLLDSITLLPENQTKLKSVTFPSGRSEANFTEPTNPKATFFILGWIAQRLPNLVRRIQSRGHEVASHGYNHLMCDRMDPESLEQDLIQSKKTIEDITGLEVRGYRAPSFSINNTAIDFIRKCGYRYDSSYNNFSRHGRYGTISLNGYRKSGIAVKIRQDLIELPISNLTIANQVIPWGGGGYFRLLPLSTFKSGLRRILDKTGTYMFYMHPWEIDPNQPRVKKSRSLSSLRHYLNLNKTHQRLRDLITAFKNCRFPTCTQYIKEIIQKT